MNFRLEEMSRELQPSNDEIERLSTELGGNSEEIRTIKRFAKSNRRTMQDKQHQIEVLKRKLESQKTSLMKKRRIIQMFTIDLTEGVAREDVAAKADKLKELHDKYVAAHNLEETLKDANETIDEHTRQRKHLQQSVMLLQRQVQQQKEITTKHYTSKSAENSVLLNDINRLQKENRTLKKRLESTNSDVEMLKSSLIKARQSTKSAMRPRVTQQNIMDNYMKEKTKTTAQTSHAFSILDSRGNIFH